MDNIIAGVIGVAMIVVFLGFYVIKLNSIPLWIIIAGIIAMISYEFYESIAKSEDQNGD